MIATHPRNHLSGAGNTDGSLLNGFDDEPGCIWKEKDALTPKAREALGSLPVLCIEDGVVKVNSAAVNALTNDSAKNVAQRFVNRVKRTFEEASGTSVCVPLKKPMLSVNVEENTVCDNVPPVVPTTPPPLCKKMAPKVDVMKVPKGVCGGDRLRLFDVTRKSKSTDFISIDKDAYDGKPLDYKNPPFGYKVLSGDGDGYVVGGNPVQQHAVRLAVHKEVCKDFQCKFMGCANDACSHLFTGVDPDQVEAYKVHWQGSRRSAISKHSKQLLL